MVEEDTQTICHNLVTEDSEHFSNSLPVAPFPFSFETELSTSRVYEKPAFMNPMPPSRVLLSERMLGLYFLD